MERRRFCLAWRFGPAGGLALDGRWEGRGTYVKLPPLNVLPGILVGNDNHQPRDLAADHPLVQLAHDALDIGLDLVVGRDCDC